MRLTNPKSRGDKRTAVAESVKRRDKKDRRLTRLKLMLGSRSANFYDLHRVNQVIQHKIITKKIQRQAQERMEKEEECLLRLKKK